MLTFSHSGFKLHMVNDLIKNHDDDDDDDDDDGYDNNYDCACD